MQLFIEINLFSLSIAITMKNIGEIWLKVQMKFILYLINTHSAKKKFFMYTVCKLMIT